MEESRFISARGPYFVDGGGRCFVDHGGRVVCFSRGLWFASLELGEGGIAGAGSGNNTGCFYG